MPLSGVILVLLALYPLAMSFQGIDPTDFGFAAAASRFIFSAPESISSDFNYWLSWILAGFWDSLFGWMLGAYSIRLAYVAEVWLCLYLGYRVLREGLGFSPRASAFALAPALLFVHHDEQGAMNWLHYNDVSGACYTLAIALLLLAAKREKRALYFAAGMALGLNPFLRFPNIVGVVLLPVWFFFDRKDWKPKLGISSAGVFSGIAFGISIALCFGHAGMVFDCWKGSLNGQLGLQGHPVRELFVQYFVSILRLIPVVLYSAGIGLIVLLASRFSVRWPRAVAMIMGAIAAFALARFGVWPLQRLLYPLMGFGRGVLPWLHWSPAGYAAAAFLAAGWEARRQGNARLFGALAISLLAMVLIPLGSNRLMLNFHFGAWMLVAISTALLWESVSWFGMPRERWRWALSVLLLAAVASLVMRDVSTVARDAGRLDATHFTHDARLGPMTTSAARAKDLTAFAQAVREHVPQGETLLSLESLPIAHYVAGMPSPLGSSWPTINLTIDESRRRLDAFLENHRFPALVTTKGLSIGDWANPLKLRDGVHGEYTDLADSLIRRGNYQKVWEEGFLELWLASDGSRG